MTSTSNTPQRKKKAPPAPAASPTPKERALALFTEWYNEGDAGKKHLATAARICNGITGDTDAPTQHITPQWDEATTQAMLECGLIEPTPEEGTFQRTTFAESLQDHIEMTKGCVYWMLINTMHYAACPWGWG